MENYYTITKIEAQLITYFEYAPNQAINPFVGEQKDGLLLVSQPMYELLKDRLEFKKIDWMKVPLVPKDQLDPKEPVKPTTEIDKEK